MKNYFNILMVSGVIGSGKTTLAKHLTKEIDGTYVSFGDYIRFYAKKEKIIASRTNLQNLGEELIRSLGYENFSKQVIDHYLIGITNSKIIIIDGVRHLEVFNIIKKMSKKCWLVFINPPINIIVENIMLRDNLCEKDIMKLLNHANELNIHQLINVADFVLDGRPFDENTKIEDIISTIKNII